METRKISLKKQFLAGLLILVPFCIVLFVCGNVLEILCNFFNKIIWNHIFGVTLWFISVPLSLLLTLTSSWIIGFVYYSDFGKKLGFPRFIDKFMGNIPLVKYLWHPNEAMDFSKIKACRVKISFGVWDEFLLLGREEAGNGRLSQTVAIYPTMPLPFTGFFKSLDEEELNRTKRIVYIKTPVARLMRKYLSFGMIRPKVEFEDEDYYERERRWLNAEAPEK